MKAVVEQAPLAVDPPAMNRVRRSGVHVEQFLTVAEAAQSVGCCEETIRRAYLVRQLDVLRFGARTVSGFGRLRWLPGSSGGGKTTA